MQSMEEGYYKIGVSKKPQRRLKQLQTGNSSELKLINTYSSEFANKIEKFLHNIYSGWKKNGEWFDIPITEALGFVETCQKIEENFVFLKENGNSFI